LIDSQDKERLAASLLGVEAWSSGENQYEILADPLSINVPSLS
jgi:hypothetical protein